MLYSLSRDVRGCPLNVALRVISQTLFETKKLFALAYVSELPDNSPYNEKPKPKIII
jgi:hypothetical protein